MSAGAQRRERKQARQSPIERHIRLPSSEIATRAAVARFERLIDNAESVIEKKQAMIAKYMGRVAALSDHLKKFEAANSRRARERVLAALPPLDPIPGVPHPDPMVFGWGGLGPPVDVSLALGLSPLSPEVQGPLLPGSGPLRPMPNFVNVRMPSGYSFAAAVGSSAALFNTIDLSHDDFFSDDDAIDVQPASNSNSNSSNSSSSDVDMEAAKTESKFREKGKKKEEKKQDLFEDPDCPVCFEPLTLRNCDVYPSCGKHIFCCTCLAKLDAGDGCPICRKGAEDVHACDPMGGM